MHQKFSAFIKHKPDDGRFRSKPLAYIKVFYYQLMHKRIASKDVLQFALFGRFGLYTHVY